MTCAGHEGKAVLLQRVSDQMGMACYRVAISS